MVDASDRGWGAGWPTDRREDMVELRVDDVDFPGGVHEGVHDLMEILLAESVSRGYVRLRNPGCWGYAPRFIKNPPSLQPPLYTTTPSNHSWGLAIDVNAPANCFGCVTHSIPTKMGKFWTEYGFRWGGDYTTTKDWMHFEYMGTPAEAKQATLRAREDLMEDERLDQYEKGYAAYIDKYREDGGEDPGPPLEDRPNWFKKGWNFARFAATNPHGE
jgi:D-alanyl-D-alanine carboxypeptidase